MVSRVRQSRGWLRFGAMVVGLWILCSPNPSFADVGHIRVAAGLGGLGSEWRGDGALATQLKLGFRLFDVVGLYGDFGLAYADVDQRVITQFAIGIQAWARIGITRPFVRVSLVHQHEESLSVIAGDFGRAILGLGEGIRHRGGVGFGLGTDIPVYRRKKLELFLTVEAIVKWFPGDMGPAVYAGGALSFGLNYGV